MLKFVMISLMLVSSSAFAECKMWFSENSYCDGAGYDHQRLMKQVISILQDDYGYKLVNDAVPADLRFYIETSAEAHKNKYSSTSAYHLSSRVRLFQKIDPRDFEFTEIFKGGQGVSFSLSIIDSPKTYENMLALTKEALKNFPRCQN